MSKTRGIYERPKGSGNYYVRFVDENGKLHRKRVGSKRLAIDTYRKMKTEVYERRFFPDRYRRGGDIQFSIMIDDALQRSVHLRSYKEYKRAADWWKAALKGKTAREINPGDIERAISKRRQEVAPATVNRLLAFVKRAYNLALSDGSLDSNPVRKVKMLKENNRRVRYLSEDEEKSLRAELSEHDWPIVAVALHTGFRRANVFGLLWADVDLDAGNVTARNPKGGEDYHVPMNDDLREILAGLPTRSTSKWVFPSPTGKQALDAQNFRNLVFMPALKRASIAGFRWHDLRHTFATRLLMGVADLATVQSLLGHKTIEMTMRYAHLSSGHRRAAVQLLNASARTDTTTDTRTAVGNRTSPRRSKKVDSARKSQCARRELNPQPTDSKSAALSN